MWHYTLHLLAIPQRAYAVDHCTPENQPERKALNSQTSDNGNSHLSREADAHLKSTDSPASRTTRSIDCDSAQPAKACTHASKRFKMNLVVPDIRPRKAAIERLSIVTRRRASSAVAQRYTVFLYQVVMHTYFIFVPTPACYGV